MNTTTAKPTPGPWEAVSYISIGSGRRIWNVQTKAREDFGTFVTQADAVLFAEALNVRQEIGLTPRQLADQRAELLAALEEIEQWKLPRTGEFHPDGTEMSYGWCFGANGERDHIRGVAQRALARAKAVPK